MNIEAPIFQDITPVSIPKQPHKQRLQHTRFPASIFSGQKNPFGISGNAFYESMLDTPKPFDVKRNDTKAWPTVHFVKFFTKIRSFLEKGNGYGMRSSEVAPIAAFCPQNIC